MNVTKHDFAALVLRISLGFVFIAHGLLKVLVYSVPGTVQYFESVGFYGWLAYPVIAAEIGGGLLLLAGIRTRLLCIGLLPVLLGALSIHIGNGWVYTNRDGGWEYVVFLIAALVTQFLLGDGEYAVKLPALRNKGTAQGTATAR